MADRTIKTKLTLEGAQEFKRGMSDAANSIKVLNSEQKLADATFRATGDAQQYLSDKADILRRKMEEQQKAVQAAQQAVNQLNAQGFSENSREMQYWQTRLNNANATLQDMQTELNKTEKELGEQGTAMDTAGNKADTLDGKLGNIGKNVDFEVLIRGLDRIQNFLESIIKKAAQAAKALWDMEAGAGKWADDLMTSASVAGFDVETYQAMQYASRFVDTSVDTIVSARQKLLKQMEKAMEPPKVTEKGGIRTEDYNDAWRAFAKLGVSVDDAGGQMRDQTQVFYEVIDALGKIGNETERDAAAMEVMGKGARELNPLIEAGSKEYQRYVDEGREVAVVSEENVKALGKLDDANQKLEATLEKTKYDTLAELAPVFTEVSEAMTKAVTGFDEFLQSEAGQAALKGLKDALTGIVDSFTEQDFTGLVNAAKDAVTGLTDALDWISKNGDSVAGIVKGIGAAWATVTVSKEVLQFLQMANALKGLFSKGGSIGGGGTGGAGGSSWVSGAAGTWFKNTFLPAAATGAGVLMESGVLPVTAAVASGAALERAAYNRDFGRYNEAMQASEAVRAVEAAGDQRIVRMQALYEQMVKMTESGGGLTNEQVGTIFAARDELEKLTGKSYGALDELEQAVKEAGGNTGQTDYDLQKVLGNIIADLTESIQQAAEGATKAAGDTATEAAEQTSEKVAAVAEEKIAELNEAKAELEATEREAVQKAAESTSDALNFDDLLADMHAEMDKISTEMNTRLDEITQSVYGQAAEKAAAAQEQEAQAMEANLAQMKAQVEADWLGIQSSTEASAQAAGEVYGPSMASGMDASEPVAAAQAISDSVIEEAARPGESADVFGRNVSVGMANGIYAGSGAAIGAAQALANAVKNTIKSALLIFSPSKVMAQLGGYIAEGMAEGMEDETWRVERASSRMAAAAYEMPVRGRNASGAAAASGSDGKTTIRNVIMIDGRMVADELTPYVSDNMAAQVRVAR